MFNKTTVENDLIGIVGVRNPNDPDYAVIDVANQASTSGYYVTDIPLAKVQYFKDSQDYEGISDADFNELLRTVQKSSIISVCNQVFAKEDFIDRNLLYTRPTNNTDAETLPDGFVGYKIEVDRQKNLAFEIPRVILDFHSNYPNDIVLQLYCTGQPDPLQETTINITEQHQEATLNWVVDNSGTTYKGDYYLGYVKSASTPIPFKRDYNAANVISAIDKLCITPIKVAGHTGSILFDLDSEDGLSENIGVNPDILVYDDYTDFIKQNKRLFARAVQLQMAILMINESFSSLRVNKNERIADTKIVQIIDGVQTEDGKLKIVGLRPQLFTEISMIKKELEKLRHNYFGGRIKVITLT